jgi:hypothetical protein
VAKDNENIGILANLPDTQEATVPSVTPPEAGIDRDTTAILANLPDREGADPNAVLGLRGAPSEPDMDSTHRNFLAFGIDPSVYNNVKSDFDHQAKLHPQGVSVLNVTDLKLDARADQHAADPSIPVIRQGQPLTKWQKTRLWFEDQFGITAKRQLDFEAQREGLSPEELADRVGANNVRLDRYLKFDPAAGAAGVLEGVAGGLEWLTGGEIGRDFANQMQILRDEMSPVGPNFLDQVSQGAGSMAMFFIPGLGVGSGVARIFATAPRVANILGASIMTGTMTALEAMTEAGLVWRDVYRKTNDQEQADKAANATFWLNVPLLFVTNRLGIFAEGGNSLSRFMRSAALEGTQETGQEIISASATGEEIKFKDLATAFGVGAIIGGGAGTVTGILQRVEAEPTAPPTPLETAPVDLADIAEQVETGTLTEEDAISQAIDRLIEPIESEEGAITIGREPEMTPQERELAIDRGLTQFRETGEIDMASPVADEIIAESLILDELGAEGTAETVMKGRRKREIEARGAEQAARLQDFRQGRLEEELRQRAIDEELTLFSETGAIDLTSPVALDVIKAHIMNEAYTVRDNFNDILDIGRSIFAEGKAKFDEFSARIKEVLGEAWEKVKPYLKTAWDVLNNERGVIDIESPLFKRFFKDSKVVDEGGNPLLVFHGTSSLAFRTPKVPDGGLFFTDKPEVAQEFGPRQITAYLSLQNPHIVDFKGEKTGKDVFDEIDFAKENNFDGLIVKNVSEGSGLPLHQQIVVFNRGQIRVENAGILGNERGAIRIGPEGAPKKPKTQIREAVGLSKAEAALVREDVALKEGIRQAVRASREAFRAGRKEGIAEAETRLQGLISEAKSRAKREATGKKVIALTISENLPPGVRGQFVKALADARTPAQFTKLATRVGDAIDKFQEAQKLKKNLATQRQKLGFIRKVGEFNQTVINEIKQEVGLTKPLTQATEAQLSEITDRLKARLRFKRSRGFNPQIEGRGTEKPDIQDTVYKANRDLSLNQKSEFRRKLTDAKEAAGETVDKLLGTISSRLADINPKLRDALRRFEFKTMTQIQKDQKAVLPFLNKAAKMSKEDHFDFDMAVKNGDVNKTNELIDRYSMRAEYDRVRSILDDIYKRAQGVGFDIGYQQNYFPRQIKDTKGFLEWFQAREDWSIIQEAIQRKEMALGRVLDFDEKVSLINTMIRGYSGGNITLSETGAMKQRVIDFVSPELNQFYEDSLSTLSNYIGQVDEAIEQRVFFGKSRPIDGDAQDFNNLDDSLGFYITDLITKGLISPSQEKELRQILQARFGERGTSGAIGIYKNLSYLTLLGSPLNAVTQLGDMAFSLYAGGVKNVLTSLPQAIIGKSVIKKEDIGIEKIAAEVENKSKIADLVDRVFRITGLTKIDTVGKETLINSVILKYQKIAKNEAEDVATFEAFEAQMQEIFGDETVDLMEDLRNDVISENVKYLAFNELLNFQPIALSEVPEVYLKAGNGRIFYALKTWTLKMLDVYRNEVFRTMRTDKVQGVQNMLRLSAWLVAMNATADIIKSIMKGEDLDDEDVQYDILVDNLLKLIGFSRYSAVQARRDGIGSAVTDQITPPTNIIDDISKDIGMLWKDPVRSWEINKLRSIKNIPVIGQLYYWWFGRRAEKKRR